MGSSNFPSLGVMWPFENAGSYSNISIEKKWPVPNQQQPEKKRIWFKMIHRNWIPSGKLTWLWEIIIFHGKIHYKWPFSIAMLNYQRIVQFSKKTSSITNINFVSPSATHSVVQNSTAVRHGTATAWYAKPNR